MVKTVGDPEKESNDGKPLIQVVSSEGLYVQGTVSESKMNKLKVGATLSGYSYDNGVSFTAEVREISPYPSDNGQDGANASSYPFTAYIADASGLSNNSWAELTCWMRATDRDKESIWRNLLCGQKTVSITL